MIMRRIIGAAFALALTACAEAAERPVDEVDAAPAGAADVAVETAPPLPAPEPADPQEPGIILFLGTSLTAGYGLGADLAYPARLQEKIDSAGLPFHVRNAGISGETSAGGLRRIDWALQSPIEVLVLELGANDGLRGLDPARMRANLDEILRRARDRYPDVAVLLLGMEAPPNLGERYTRRFRDVYRELAEAYDAVLVPFLLEGVAGVPALNQADGLHPTAEGQRRMAETVWQALAPMLEARAAAR
jgi:acyl-CoA thioesterase-1